MIHVREQNKTARDELGKSWGRFPSEPAIEPESPQRTGATRRDFLKAAGFTFSSAFLAACSRAPVEKAIPYLIQPEEVTPGRAYFYTSACGGCSAGCGLLVKNVDGRPIKLEGNPNHPLSRGGLCAMGQGSLLGLYDSQRLRGPLKGGRPRTWDEVNKAVMAEFARLRESRAAVRFLSSTMTSSTLRALVQDFLAGFPDARHVIYDLPSSSAILDAHQLTHGVRVLPRFHFERAEVIVSFDADFLGTWISPVEFTRGYMARRAPESPENFSYHVQFESRMSLTGAKADHRVPIAPGNVGLVMTHLARRLAAAGRTPFNAEGIEPPPVPDAFLDNLAERLLKARRRSLVVCGVEDRQLQLLANFLNQLLENYGSTLDIEHPSFELQGNDHELESLLAELKEGKVGALFVAGANPVYDLPNSEALTAALERVPLLVSFAPRLDETASLAHYVCPDSHELESWGDAEPVSGILSIRQPAIRPLVKARSLLETLSVWSGRPKSGYELVREHWQADVFPRWAGKESFETFWEQALETGWVEVKGERLRPKAFDFSVVNPILQAENPSSGELALVLYPKVSMRNGLHAYNPWLQELPDPISKVAWDNYACISPGTASQLGLRDGDVIRLEAAGRGGKSVALDLPAFVQPGQHEQVVAVALGYGSNLSQRFRGLAPEWLDARPTTGEDGRVGKNAAPFLVLDHGLLSFTRNGVRLTKTGRFRELASTQTQPRLAPERLRTSASQRGPAVHETTLGEFVKSPSAGNERPPQEKEDLWPADHPYPGHRWGMVIDLNACTGCSACVIACQAENNIPVVGQDEVRRGREMYWIRLDRYYSGTEENPDVAFQPMLCQQCENAPCETVCPVLATVHNAEGLNVQVYNRCVGTRYCENNCPYKVRRFNWFDYAHDDSLANLALNPDVTVRSRGVMEKCSFCIQRIQEAKIESNRLGEKLADGTIQTACQQSCPAQAIVFGDLNDRGSRAAQLASSARSYRVLEELNVRPAVGYLTVVRNRTKEGHG